MGGFGPNLLAGLVGGYADAQNVHHHEELKNQVEQKDSILKYLSGMASSQEVPAEHRQWAAQKATEYLNWQPGQKLPKLELTGPKGLPAVTYQPPTIHGPSGIAPITLNGQGSLAPNPDPTGPVPLGGNKPGDSIQLPAPPPMTIPGSTSTVSMPTPPPQVISPAGVPYRMTDADVVNRKVDLLQSQVPTLTREAAAAHVLGTEPKDADFINVPQGGTLVDKKTGKAVYTASAKPEKPDSPEQQFTDEYQKKNPNATIAQAQRAYAENKQVKDAKDNIGTWSLQEDKDGNAVMFNSKTGTTKAAPTGLQAKGTFAKQKQEFDKNVAPVLTARDYADSYIKDGAFTGPGDEALMEKFFEVAKPSSGFRMSQPQINMLNNARGWMSSAEAHFRHATSGTWFSDDQRKQIAGTMKALSVAKLNALGSKGISKPSAPPASGINPHADIGFQPDPDSQ